MRRLRAILVWILSTLFSAWLSAAEEITHISVIHADTGRETALERRLPIGIAHPTIGDRVVLHAGKSGNYSIEVTESRRSKFGNSIVHGVTPSGGSSLLVFSQSGSVTGNLYAYDGKVQITTENEVTTAWRMGIDALPIPIDDGGIAPPAEELVEAVSMRKLDDRAASKKRTAPTAQAREGEYILPSFKVGPHVIDVLMYYDNSIFDPSGVVDYTIELTNEALKNSEVSASVSVVSLKPVTVSSSDSNRDLQRKLEDGSAPFERVHDDAREEDADLVILLRGNKAEEDDNCGIADLSFSRGSYFVTGREGVVEWRPSGNDWTCSEFSMAHEIGHLLGAKHQRDDYGEDSPHSATSYSYGYVTVSGETVMATQQQGEELPLFSNPDVLCLGVPCGSNVPDRFELSSGANNARAFRLTTPSISGREGDYFSFESVSVFPVDGEFSECESDGESGFWKAHAIFNQYKEEISWAEVHYIRENGSARSFSFAKGESTIPSGYYSYRGWCNTENNSDSTDFVESFARYYHPDTDELVETGHVYFEDDYDGEYSVIRVATSSGGRVIGHPEQHVRVGARHLVSFVPDPFYKLDRLVTNCDGADLGDDTYIVEVSEDDCRIEAFFEDGGFDVRVQYHFNSLLDSIEDSLSGRSPSGDSACIGACD
jgi:hypothetical protein